MDDRVERAVAQKFSPVLIGSKDERCGEHETFYQVHPTDSKRVLITYVVTFKDDCGFPAFGLGRHHGDTQELRIEAFNDGTSWRQTDLQLTWFAPIPLQDERARIYYSAGKHHLYPSMETCRKGMKGKLEHCGGGPEEVEVLLPEYDAGERAHPKLASLARFGYAGETGWGASRWGDDLFCGGDPKRGGNGGLMSRLKGKIAWGTCGESLGLKWR